MMLSVNNKQVKPLFKIQVLGGSWTGSPYAGQA